MEEESLPGNEGLGMVCHFAISRNLEEPRISRITWGDVFEKASVSWQASKERSLFLDSSVLTFHGWGKSGPERFSGLLRITQQVYDRVRTPSLRGMLESEGLMQNEYELKDTESMYLGLQPLSCSIR